jgi:hypothetical protein
MSNTPQNAAAPDLGLGQPHAWGWNGGSCYVSGEAIVIGGEGSAATDRPIIEAKAQVIAAKDLMIEALKRIAADPYRGGVTPAQARELARNVLRLAGIEVADASDAATAPQPAAAPPAAKSTATAAPPAQHRPKSQFTADQLALLRTCKNAGHGWAKFAASVERLGRCTPGQEQTLRNMVERIRAMSRDRGQRAGDYGGDEEFDREWDSDFGQAYGLIN